jgi:HSP20 family protein
MRYRRLSYRYALVLAGDQSRPLADARLAGLPGLRFGPPSWRPPADVCVSDRAIEVTVELAGVDQDELEVVLFQDALIIEGQRRLPLSAPNSVYHVAEIRQGPFRLELGLPEAIDPQRVEARYDQGLLRITFPKARTP